MIVAVFFQLATFVAAAAVLTAQQNFNDYLASMIAVWITLVVIVVFDFLVMNLVILHIYLFFKGITTFELIMLMKEEERRPKHAKTPEVEERPAALNVFEMENRGAGAAVSHER